MKYLKLMLKTIICYNITTFKSVKIKKLSTRKRLRLSKMFASILFYLIFESEVKSNLF